MVEDDVNPYQSPSADALPRSGPFGPNEATIRFVRRFRNQIHVLGGFLIALAMLDPVFLMPVLGDLARAGVRWAQQGDAYAAAVCGMWFFLAVLTFAKQTWAVVV